MTDWNYFIKLVLKKIWIVVLVAGLAVILTAYVSYYRLPALYEASMKVFVLAGSPPQDEGTVTYDQLMASQLLAKSYKEMIINRSVFAEVIKDQDLGELTENKLGSRIKVDIVPDSSILQISVRDEDPWKAITIANEINKISSKRAATSVIGIKSVTIVDNAMSDMKPVYPKPILYISLSLVIGITVSLCIILLMNYLSMNRKDNKSISL